MFELLSLLAIMTIHYPSCLKNHPRLHNSAFQLSIHGIIIGVWKEVLRSQSFEDELNNEDRASDQARDPNRSRYLNN